MEKSRFLRRAQRRVPSRVPGRSLRRSLCRALAVALALGTSLTVLSAGTASAGPVSRSVTGTCRLPGGGTVPMAATTAVTFPDTAVTGQPIRPTDLSVRLDLPAQLGATGSVSGTVGLTLTAAAQKVDVTGLTVPSTPLPASGDVTLTATGAAPAVTPTVAGQLEFDLAAVTATITTANGSVTCTENPNQAGELASVPVTGAPAPVNPPKGAVTPADSLLVSYWVDSISTMTKLNSSVKIGRGVFNSEVDLSTGNVTGTLTLPPSAGHFLSFRFVPVASVVTLSQAGPVNGKYTNGVLSMTIPLSIGLSDVAVNGVPLNVGSGCRTATPISLQVSGSVPLTGSTPSTLKSSVTIPAFTGCGVTENLSPLLTGLVSGPGNPVWTTLTLRCSVTCPPN